MYRITKVIEALPESDCRREWWDDVLNLILAGRPMVAIEKLKVHSKDHDYQVQIDVVMDTIGQVYVSDHPIILTVVEHTAGVLLTAEDTAGFPVQVMVNKS